MLLTDKFNIIIDLLDNGKYRYSSWSRTKNLKNSPDLILKNGMKKESIDKITYEFKNGEFTYLCTFNKLKNNGYLKVIQNQKELIQKKSKRFYYTKRDKKIYWN